MNRNNSIGCILYGVAALELVYGLVPIIERLQKQISNDLESYGVELSVQMDIRKLDGVRNPPQTLRKMCKSAMKYKDSAVY